MFIIRRLFYILIALLFYAPSAVAQEPTDEPLTSAQKSLEISFVEHLGGKKLRIHLSAFETQGGVRYPMMTLDRESFLVEFPNTSSAPASADSLSIYGGSNGDFRRATVIAFNLDLNLTEKAAAELKTQLSDIIPKIPSSYLSVMAVATGSSRLIGDVTPEKSENINRLQRDLVALERAGQGSALSDILCLSAEHFRTWGLRDFKQGDQKALIIINPPGDSKARERSNAQNCFAILHDQGVRVFQVEYGASQQHATDLASLAPLTKGFVQRVNSAQDSFPALNNIVNNLRNEYVLDVTAPDIALEDQPLEIDVKVTYHDEIFRTGPKSVGFIIPTLAQVFNPPPAPPGPVVESVGPRPLSPIVYVLIGSGTVLLLLLVLGIRTLIHKRYSTTCNTCGRNVLKDFSNCDFRNNNVFARLVFIGGPLSGRMIPLRSGNNRISRYFLADIRIPGPGVKWFKQGMISLTSTKALYVPSSKKPKELINGWQVLEPRLLSTGSIIRIGRHQLRFEANPKQYKSADS